MPKSDIKHSVTRLSFLGRIYLSCMSHTPSHNNVVSRQRFKITCRDETITVMKGTHGDGALRIATHH